MQLRKAARQKAKIRLGLSAASGGGKTISALLIAYGITGDWDKIALIDTENGSADLYANHKLPNGTTIGEFQVLPFSGPYPPEKYIEAITACEQAGVEVIIIDSITHEWDGEGGILRIADGMTGDSFSKWKVLTPRHQAFIDKILKSTCHIITTVRRKQEFAMIKDETSGKNRVEKLGLKEITRDGFDYELTVNLELDQNHNTTVGKDRTGLFAGKPSFIPGEATGRLILEWCESGADLAEQVQPAIDRLEECTNQDELEMLIDTLPLLVAQDATFVTAVNARMADFRKMKADALTLAGDYEQALLKIKTPDELTDLLQRVSTLPDEYKVPLQKQISDLAKKSGWKSNKQSKRYEAANASAQSEGLPASNSNNPAPAADKQKAATSESPTVQAAPASEQKQDDNPAEKSGQQIGWFTERIGKEVWMQAAADDTDPEAYSGVFKIEDENYPDWMFRELQGKGYTFREATSEELAAHATAVTAE